MKNTSQGFARVWWVLLAGPILFLLGIVVMSLYYGIASRGQNVDAIPTLVAASTPYQLVVIQILLLIILVSAMKRDGMTWQDIGWSIPRGHSAGREALIGGAVGVALGLLYVYALSPLLSVLQGIWDYVPPGDLLSTLGSALIPFALANVVFAPFVEEAIYRGYGLTRLLQRFGQPAAIFLSCLLFGLLHWTGGFWYILLVGGVAGGLFVWLRISRNSLIAPFAAHLALNIVETIFVVMGR